MPITRLLPLGVLVGLCTLALPSPSPAAEGPCAADVKKLCAGIERGGGRVAKCLKDHEAELSDACKAQITQAKAFKEHHQACAADAEKFCKDVRPGEGRVAKCLKQHEADLSAECKAERAANRQKRSGSVPTLAPAAKQ